MTDDLINEAGRLMEEQVRDYAALEIACSHLAEALIQGEVSAIEAMTRASDKALLQMRARLVRIIQALTAFADVRASTNGNNPLGAIARGRFEAASKDLMMVAVEFQRTRARASALTTSGATFATACIEFCGIQPSTYRGPYARVEGRTWG